MKNVLFVMPPALGHLNAVSPISIYLKEQGYRVVYMGTSGISEYVLNQGDDLFISNTIPVGLNLDVEIKKLLNDNISYLDILSDKIKGKDVNDRRHDLEKAFNLVSPELVFIDSYLSTDFILIYNLAKQRGSSIFFIQTMLSCDDNISSNKGSSIINTFHKYQQYFLRKLELAYEKLKYIGYDDTNIVHKIFKEAEIPQQYSIIGKNFFHWSFNGIPELILAPEELEITASKRDNQYYLGIPNTPSILKKLDSLDENIWQYVQNSKINSKGLIYISFGSQYTNKLALITTFLFKLDSVLSDINTKAIFSLGGKELSFERRFENILVVPFISHNVILKECQLFISHGGLNSIKDAILGETPLIVYPLEGDQINNAKKVSFHQIGLAGNIIKETYSGIKKKICIVSQQEQYSVNITQLKKIILKKYNYTAILDNVINTHKKS